MEIRQLTEVTPEVVQAIDKLIPQLSKYITSPSLDDLEKIIHSGNTILFIAEEKLLWIPTPTVAQIADPSDVASLVFVVTTGTDNISANI